MRARNFVLCSAMKKMSPSRIVPSAAGLPNGGMTSARTQTLNEEMARAQISAPAVPRMVSRGGSVLMASPAGDRDHGAFPDRSQEPPAAPPRQDDDEYPRRGEDKKQRREVADGADRFEEREVCAQLRDRARSEKGQHK